MHKHQKQLKYLKIKNQTKPVIYPRYITRYM